MPREKVIHILTKKEKKNQKKKETIIIINQLFSGRDRVKPKIVIREKISNDRH